MKIAVSGLGYVGLSNAVLLSQHNEVIALDVVPEKVDMIRAFPFPAESKGDSQISVDLIHTVCRAGGRQAWRTHYLSIFESEFWRQFRVERRIGRQEPVLASALPV